MKDVTVIPVACHLGNLTSPHQQIKAVERELLLDLGRYRLERG